MTKQINSDSFSTRRPFLFGLILLTTVVLVVTAVAFLSGQFTKDGSSPFSADSLSDLVSPQKFGLVRIEGAILDSESICEWIYKLRYDDSVVGVLVRIDSPGGAVAPSQEIYRAVKRLSDKKPTVVSMGSVAASGGYYAAAPARLIIANPATITGSIGVIMQLSDLRELAEKIGIGQRTLTTGAFKDAGSPFKPFTDKERAVFQGVIDDMHEQFVSHVAAGRNMTLNEVRELADGRIYTGREARLLGLVDELGDLETAYERLRDLTGVGDKTMDILEGPKKNIGLLGELFGSKLNGGGEITIDLSDLLLALTKHLKLRIAL